MYISFRQTLNRYRFTYFGIIESVWRILPLRGVNALCFTVEIDRKRFPDVSDFTVALDKFDVLYMSNEYDLSEDENDGICYRFEFDDNSLDTVSFLLTELVKNDFLCQYADSIIDTNYCNIDKNDKDIVISDILRCADSHKISVLIRDFINENMHIHLGGFVLFRMKEYLSDFEDEIDFAIDEYMQQKRYQDFINFLKFFIDIQEPTVDKINLVIEKNGDYRLLDADGVPISKDILDSTYCEISTLEEDDGYIMLNDLISLAPKSITVHCGYSGENYDTIKIINEIFDGRVDVCHHCKICSC